MFSSSALEVFAMDKTSSLSAKYLREALLKTSVYRARPTVLSNLIKFCESAEPRTAARYLRNILQGDCEHVIQEYLRRRCETCEKLEASVSAAITCKGKEVKGEECPQSEYQIYCSDGGRVRNFSERSPIGFRKHEPHYGQGSKRLALNNRAHIKKFRGESAEENFALRGRTADEIFDICTGKKIMASPRDMEIKNSSAATAQHLMSGMVLLKNWLSRDDQINIVNICREFGIGEGGFYQPGYGDGCKMHLWMMCFGKNWNPQKKTYEHLRSHDNAETPAIPGWFVPLVHRAIGAAHDAIIKEVRFMGRDVEDLLPGMTPDVCIVNFYKEGGRLGLHQDKDESRSSIRRGLPVVSFSIGDSAEFLYGERRDVENAERVVMKSGDVLIFGGESRLVFHGISHVMRNTSPDWLIQQTGLRPGRLNLTFRQI